MVIKRFYNKEILRLSKGVGRRVIEWWIAWILLERGKFFPINISRAKLKPISPS